MALTDEQRVDVRFYLGWSDRFHQFDSRLEQAMNAIDMRGQASIDKVTAQIDTLKEIDSAISGAEARFRASKVGEIILNPREVKQLRARGRQEVGRLASFLGVPVRHDVFGTHGPSSFASRDGLAGGGNRQLIG